MPKRRRVAILVGTEREHRRGVLRGIARYAHLHAEWELVSEPTYSGGQLPLREVRRCHGVVLYTATRQKVRTLRQSGLPVVSIIKTYAEEDIAQVSVDASAVARLATEHFLERNFHHFAFCELDQTSRDRCDRMVEQLAARGLPCHVFRVEYKCRNDWIFGKDRRRLESWIRRLPKPVGILAHNDVRGRHVIDACRRLGFNVPEEVAVLGVDNELPHCEMCHPQLSSIITDAQRAGFEAASLLARLMEGDSRGPMQITVPPLGIVTRQSTDVTATSDRYVATAVRYIREHACSGINVGDVLRQIVISRTALDNRFIACLGRSVHDEILRVRLKRAQELLTKTEFSIEVIAARTGFHHGQYLGAVFRREFGQSPGEYRNQNKAALSPRSATASEQE